MLNITKKTNYLSQIATVDEICKKIWVDNVFLSSLQELSTHWNFRYTFRFVQILNESCEVTFSHFSHYRSLSKTL